MRGWISKEAAIRGVQKWLDFWDSVKNKAVRFFKKSGVIKK
jgi:hypothetical protein